MPEATSVATMRPKLLDQLRQAGEIRTVQELLGHADFGTTMCYTHVLDRDVRGV
jgi:site-specific recombinase XerD